MSVSEPEITDDKFMKNVREARENGYDLACVECGSGIYDDTDDHDLYCPQNPEYAENVAMRAAWIAKRMAESQGGEI